MDLRQRSSARINSASWSRDRLFVCRLGAAVFALSVFCHSAAASVITAPLEWRVKSIEVGLEHLKGEILDRSIREDTEFVGAVLQKADGTYEFTQGNGKPGQDKVSFRIRRPEGAEIVALWHTHGGHGPTRAVFSPTDAQLVRQTGLPFYLITPDGEVRVLRPEHVEKEAAGRWVKGTMARLPRGSHPGERVTGSNRSSLAAARCVDVTKV